MKISRTITADRTAYFHPIPWRVEYRQRFPEWHPKSMPYVADANGDVVCDVQKTDVIHPGDYDIVADLTAITIVDCVNAASGTVRCPECGYTQEDCELHRDHHLCHAYPFFAFELNDGRHAI